MRHTRSGFAVRLHSRKSLLLSILGVLFAAALLWSVLDYYLDCIPQNIQAVSQIYLEEIACREAGYLEDKLDSQFDALKISERKLRVCGEMTPDKLENFLRGERDAYGFSFLVLANEAEGYTPREGRLPVAALRTMKDVQKDRLVTFDLQSDCTLLGMPIEPVSPCGVRYTAIVVGIPTDQIVPNMEVTGYQIHSTTSVVASNGAYVAGQPKLDTRTPEEADLFTRLAVETEMLEGFSIDKVREDMKAGRGGMICYSENEVNTYLCYEPVAGADWYIVTRMPYQTINPAVQRFMQLTSAVGELVVVVLTGLIIFFLIFAYRSQNARAYAESISATLEKTDQEKHQAEKALERMAFYDDLTGIPNRNLLKRTAQVLLENSAAKYVYAVADIRKFKVINDLFGYAQGDLLLKHFAYVLQKKMAEGETVARISADIFHMLLRYDGKARLEQRLMELSVEACEFSFSTGSSFRITAGFGVYVLEDRTEPVEQMGDRASLALAMIKNLHSTAVYFYNEDIRHRIIKEREIENEMQRGIDHHEFTVYFQPKYFPGSAEIAGAEALVRWKHPTRGLITPGVFIPLFEKNGFITTLDLYVLEEVCAQIRKWLDEGRKVVPVSVNQSRLLLYSTGYMGKLTQLLQKYNLPRGLVELEVTESVFFEDKRRMISIMKELHELCFTVSMDDFGAGYSSLNMLVDIMVDTLKIDKDFFSESANTERGRTIVRNIISMAQALKIKVVAEGVETQEQVEFLCTAGCDQVQGFYFSKPLPCEEFEKLLPDADKWGTP